MKHNARKKKIAGRIRANANKSKSTSNPIGSPFAGFINDDIYVRNRKAVQKACQDFRSGVRANFYHDAELGATHLMSLSDVDRTSVAHAIAKSRLLAPGESALGTAMYPVYLKHTESPYWNIGSAGSVWMDVMSDSGTPFRISYMEDITGASAFAIFPQIEEYA
jgi:hypothetical protein